MNAFQDILYQDLVHLVASDEAFYFQDFTHEGKTYRIFNYRLASYTDFLAPNALECRGVMFEVDAEGQAIRLASLPMEKFFNLNENPSTMNLDLLQVESIEHKVDGSLMSTYMHNGQLRLKSKGSLFSDQALAAMKWLDKPENVYFKQLLTDFAANDYTVNLEWLSPDNRIVIGYMTSCLKVLNVREHDLGHYADPWIFRSWGWLVDTVDLNGINPVEFVASIPKMQNDIEGYVVILKSGQRVKIKTEKYLSLHHAKDSVNNPRRLFEAVVDEGIDDLRSLFATDPVAMAMIDEMQLRVDKLYNHMVKLVETFYEVNKFLDRKDYAIKGQAELEQKYFGLAMNKYLQKPVDYKGFLKAKFKLFGIVDTSTEEKGDE